MRWVSPGHWTLAKMYQRFLKDLAENSQLSREKSLRHVPERHLPDVFPTLADLNYDRRLKAAMHHALGAAFILAYSVSAPLCLLHHLPVCGVVVVCDEVAGCLPPPGIPGRVSPRGALQLPFPLQELEIHGGGIETEPIAHLIDFLELPLDLPPLQEELFAYRFVAEAGGHQDTVYLEICQERKEHVDLHQVGLLEDRGVGADPES
jgi:hypothetical protein